MNYWFECKVSYERQADSMGMKKVSESYLVDALSFTEAEERIIKEIRPFVSVGELEVVNIRRARIAELFLNDEAEDDLPDDLVVLLQAVLILLEYLDI